MHELLGEDRAAARSKGRLLTTSEVAVLFQISERTVSGWARRGLLPSNRTPSGQLRYPAEAIARLLVNESHDWVR